MKEFIKEFKEALLRFSKEPASQQVILFDESLANFVRWRAEQPGGVCPDRELEQLLMTQFLPRVRLIVPQEGSDKKVTFLTGSGKNIVDPNDARIRKVAEYYGLDFPDQPYDPKVREKIIVQINRAFVVEALTSGLSKHIRTEKERKEITKEITLEKAKLNPTNLDVSQDHDKQEVDQPLSGDQPKTTGKISDTEKLLVDPSWESPVAAIFYRELFPPAPDGQEPVVEPKQVPSPELQILEEKNSDNYGQINVTGSFHSSLGILLGVMRKFGVTEKSGGALGELYRYLISVAYLPMMPEEASKRQVALDEKLQQLLNDNKASIEKYRFINLFRSQAPYEKRQELGATSLDEPLDNVSRTMILSGSPKLPTEEEHRARLLSLILDDQQVIKGENKGLLVKLNGLGVTLSTPGLLGDKMRHLIKTCYGSSRVVKEVPASASKSQNNLSVTELPDETNVDGAILRGLSNCGIIEKLLNRYVEAAFSYAEHGSSTEFPSYEEYDILKCVSREGDVILFLKNLHSNRLRFGFAWLLANELEKCGFNFTDDQEKIKTVIKAFVLAPKVVFFKTIEEKQRKFLRSMLINFSDLVQRDKEFYDRMKQDSFQKARVASLSLVSSAVASVAKSEITQVPAELSSRDCEKVDKYFSKKGIFDEVKLEEIKECLRSKPVVEPVVEPIVAKMDETDEEYDTLLAEVMGSKYCGNNEKLESIRGSIIGTSEEYIRYLEQHNDTNSSDYKKVREFRNNVQSEPNPTKALLKAYVECKNMERTLSRHRDSSFVLFMRRVAIYFVTVLTFSGSCISWLLRGRGLFIDPRSRGEQLVENVGANFKPKRLHN